MLESILQEITTRVYCLKETQRIIFILSQVSAFLHGILTWMIWYDVQILPKDECADHDPRRKNGIWNTIKNKQKGHWICNIWTFYIY